MMHKISIVLIIATISVYASGFVAYPNPPSCVTSKCNNQLTQSQFSSRYSPTNAASLSRIQDNSNNNHHPLFRVSSSLNAETSSDQDGGWTLDQLEDYAREEGVVLTWSTLGPGFRSVARSTHNESKVLGYAEGFIRPAGNIQHMDKMEMFQPIVNVCKTENPDFRGGGTILGVGLLFAYQCILHGQEKGCTKVEFLAIDDDDYIHRRLVKYYSLFGGSFVKYVGDDFQDIPARMVWGGCGTLMDADIDNLLPKWTRMMQKSRQNRQRLQAAKKQHEQEQEQSS